MTRSESTNASSNGHGKPPTRPRRIAVPLIDRANYGRMKPVLQAIQDHPDLELMVICSGSMVLERFGLPMDEVKADGFPVVGSVYIEIEGSVPSTMAKSVGMGVIEFASEFQRLQPDVVLCIGDRYEMMAAVLAAGFMNLCIAHIQGGEVSGSIDESIRHAITKFAHFHFPATDRSAQFICDMGEQPETVHMVGCPSGDIALQLGDEVTSDELNRSGLGPTIDPDQPYALVVFHPVTTEFGHEAEPAAEILHALTELKMPTLWLWPNIDAGSDHISKILRTFREQHRDLPLRLVKNYSPEVYARILKRASVAVGNSSSFVRDSGFYGTPVVLVGARQSGREFSENVVPCEPDRDAVRQTVEQQLEHGRYAPSTLYGRGDASAQIAEQLATLNPYVQKRIDYVNRIAASLAGV